MQLTTFLIFVATFLALNAELIDESIAKGPPKAPKVPKTPKEGPPKENAPAKKTKPKPQPVAAPAGVTVITAPIPATPSCNDPTKWKLAAKGASCETTCGAGRCTTSGTACVHQINTVEAIMKVAHTLSLNCNEGYLSTYDFAPNYDPYGMCYYNPDDKDSDCTTNDNPGLQWICYCQ